MKQHRQILSFFAILISLLCGSATHAITSGELLDTANKAEVVFLTSVADPASEPYLNVFDNDVLIKIVFDDGVSSEDEIAVEFADEGGVSGVYTLNQVVAMINTETQALGFTPDGINKNYDMADVAENSDGSYSLRLRSQFTATSQTIRYGNATAGQDARMEGVFGDVFCDENDTLINVNGMMYIAQQTISSADTTPLYQQQAIFYAGVLSPDSGSYLEVFDNDIQLRVRFYDAGQPQDTIIVVFSNNGPTGGSYTLNQVVAAINTESQSLGYAPDGTNRNYDMADITQFYNGRFALRLKSRDKADHILIEYANAVADADAYMERCFFVSDRPYTDANNIWRKTTRFAFASITKINGDYGGTPVEDNCVVQKSVIFNTTVDVFNHDAYLTVYDEALLIQIQFSNSATGQMEELIDTWMTVGTRTLASVEASINSESEHLAPGKSYDMARLIENPDGTYALKICSRGAADTVSIQCSSTCFTADTEGFLGTIVDIGFAVDVDPSLYTSWQTCGFYVNFNEFTNFADAWQTDPASENWDSTYDFNNDLFINVIDLIVMAEDWGACLY